MPVGKNNPRSIPSGNIKEIDTKILIIIAEAVIATKIFEIRSCVTAIVKTVTMGYIKIHGKRFNGKYSLKKLPSPALIIIVNSKIPNA
jgi:hypothetical protein